MVRFTSVPKMVEMPGFEPGSRIENPKRINVGWFVAFYPTSRRLTTLSIPCHPRLNKIKHALSERKFLLKRRCEPKFAYTESLLVPMSRQSQSEQFHFDMKALCYS